MWIVLKSIPEPNIVFARLGGRGGGMVATTLPSILLGMGAMVGFLLQSWKLAEFPPGGWGSGGSQNSFYVQQLL